MHQHNQGRPSATETPYTRSVPDSHRMQSPHCRAPSFDQVLAAAEDQPLEHGDAVLQGLADVYGADAVQRRVQVLLLTAAMVCQVLLDRQLTLAAVPAAAEEAAAYAAVAAAALEQFFPEGALPGAASADAAAAVVAAGAFVEAAAVVAGAGASQAVREHSAAAAACLIAMQQHTVRVLRAPARHYLLHVDGSIQLTGVTDCGHQNATPQAGL